MYRTIIASRVSYGRKGKLTNFCMGLMMSNELQKKEGKHTVENPTMCHSIQCSRQELAGSEDLRWADIRYQGGNVGVLEGLVQREDRPKTRVRHTSPR